MLNRPEDRQSSNYGATLRLAVLADDLTGACDAAAPFATRGLPTEVGVARNALPSPLCEVWSCSSESRDADAHSVEQTLARCLNALPAAGTLFKKIDSVFRGNTFAEIAAIRRLRPGGVALLAPSFPQAGRTVSDGILQIRDTAGTRTLPLLAPLRDHGLNVHRLAATTQALQLRRELERHAASKGLVLLCDADSQEHLDVLADVAREALDDPLWIGSAGLAHALAKSYSPVSIPEAPEIASDASTVLMFVGSTHAVTREQVQAIEVMQPRHAHVRIIDIPRGPAASDCVLDAVWGLQPNDVACLVVTGGDTASVVFDALGITALRVLDEFAPGLPLCRALGGRFDGVRVLLKSGGFGTDTVLCEIAERFRSAPAVVGRSAL